jgi:hypothetical protein
MKSEEGGGIRAKGIETGTRSKGKDEVMFKVEDRYVV